MGVKQCSKQPLIDFNSLDGMPDLHDESSDDGNDDRSDTVSDTSVATYNTNYFDDHVPHDEETPCAYVAQTKPVTTPSTNHSGTCGDPKPGAELLIRESKAKDKDNLTRTEVCKTCNKPYRRQHYNAQFLHCRDHCTHQHTTDDPTFQSLSTDAPEMRRGTTPLPTNLLNAKTFTDRNAEGLRSDNQPGHREKELAAGDHQHLLITWYCLVAKPITREEWPQIPAAQAAVDK